MILTDGVDVFETDAEDIKESPAVNGNTETTLGGSPKNQSDSFRLKIESKIRVTQAEMPTFKKIISNWAADIYYTPARLLLHKTEISSMRVIIPGGFRIDQRFWDGSGVVFWVVLDIEEADPE